jgi:hypothetical protein
MEQTIEQMIERLLDEIKTLFKPDLEEMKAKISSKGSWKKLTPRVWGPVEKSLRPYRCIRKFLTKRPP